MKHLGKWEISLSILVPVLCAVSYFEAHFWKLMSVTWLVNFTYRINSKKCCNAFQALNAALIRGRCLFESRTRHYYFPF